MFAYAGMEPDQIAVATSYFCDALIIVSETCDFDMQERLVPNASLVRVRSAKEAQRAIGSLLRVGRFKVSKSC